MKIVVTGATGFIGQHLVSHLLNKKYEVVAVGRSQSRLENCFGDRVHKHKTDYSLESLNEVFNGADSIVHLAAKRLSRDSDPFRLDPFIHSNILLTENVLLAAKKNGVKKVCQTSSISVYSEANQLPFNEEDLPIPANIYGVSKLACEHLGSLFSLMSDIKVTSLRLGFLYGPGEKEDLVFMKFIAHAKKKKTLIIFGTGKSSVDYIYVKDVVSAIEKAIQPEAPFGTFNIGSGRSYSVVEIAEAINEVFDNEGNVIFDVSKEERVGILFMNNNKAKTLLNCEPGYNLNSALLEMKTYMGASYD